MIDGAGLSRQSPFNAFRECASCGQRFTVDSATKRRQIVGVLIAIIALLLTLSLFFIGTRWLIPAIVSYLVLGGWVAWSNQRVSFIPYQED